MRYTFDNDYFSDTYQGIPKGGYNGFIDKLLEGCDVLLNTDFDDNRDHWQTVAEKIMYTGRIDEYFRFHYGDLEYRGLEFEHSRLETEN